MSIDIFTLTIRQVVGRRRTLALIAVALLPLLVAFVIQNDSQHPDHVNTVMNHLFRGFEAAIVLPLVTLVLATTALGQEIEDGTLVYLLSKPIQRLSIVAGKLVACALPAILIVALSTLFSSAIALQGTGESEIPLALMAAVALGAITYSCLFLLLSVLTSRALIIGLVYVFLWEGVVTNLFGGTRIFSVREYTLGVADMLAQTSTFTARLGGTTAIVLVAVVSLGAIALTARRLARFEMRGQM